MITVLEYVKCKSTNCETMLDITMCRTHCSAHTLGNEWLVTPNGYTWILHKRLYGTWVEQSYHVTRTEALEAAGLPTWL